MPYCLINNHTNDDYDAEYDDYDTEYKYDAELGEEEEMWIGGYYRRGRDPLWKNDSDYD